MGQTGTPGSITLGLANVKYGNYRLGFTVGDVEIQITHQQQDILVDDFGETPLNVYDIGTQITAIVPLTEDSLRNLSIATPEGTLTGDRIKVGRQAGTLLTAQRLVMDALAANGKNITIYRAIVMEVGALVYSNEQRVFPVTFKGLIDTTRPDGDRLFRIGGPAS